ncbi:2'-5' RNA ligase [Pseudarcicella hirudinis]|uniref:2'-5' RNA ligase n=1 Tax=Pseudarcicella hirudinis TaxID=1079859 RepID=A0A1I5Y2M0_9BACT|nr:2'-5' RNA ligase family protein [Pseudarcicella hirudinis]SFQ38438.1 2'-5' RNA ligase [Pseudarcicella hirudinis]
MNTNFLQNSEDLKYEYLLILSPEKQSQLSSEIMRIKAHFSDMYGCEKAKHLYPHITLSNFKQHIGMEKKIIRGFDRISAEVSPFQVNLNGFGGFPFKTIYLKVEPAATVPIIKIVKNIRARFGSLLGKSKFYSLTPHLTIARGMRLGQYTQAYNDWEHKPFSGDFYASEMKLLRRHPEEKYELIKSFPFSGIHYKEYIQGSLFQISPVNFYE